VLLASVGVGWPGLEAGPCASSFGFVFVLGWLLL
jgi:hypothetical protein